MNVARSQFDAVLLELSKETQLSYDTETTCIHWWDNPWYEAVGITPRVFAIQIATSTKEYYFDFQTNGLPEECFKQFNRLTEDPTKTWFIANAKFDLHHSRNHGIEFAGIVHCTKAIARVANNLEPKLNLDTLSEKYLGAHKLDVISILKERGHVTKIKKFGHNDKFDEQLHFDRLPLSESVPYGERDVRLCFDLGLRQIKCIKEWDQKMPLDRKLSNVMDNERKLTKVLFEMERLGIEIDLPYTHEAYENEVQEYSRIEKELNAVIGESIDWNSAKQLKPIFDRLGELYSYTEKGNACFDRYALEGSQSTLAKDILRYRYHAKRAHTYFENFIWLADSGGVLHTDFQQAGTETGRMSVWNPNLQNVPKRRDKEETRYKVRRCFVPRPGYIFADFDYDFAEYAMMVDYAKELTLIDEIKKGKDVHDVTREVLNLKSRDEAKTMNFGLLYGMGIQKFADALKITFNEAKNRKADYFRKLPGVSRFINEVKNLAVRRGYVFNWLGRVLQYDGQTNYKAPNGLIQGGVGDMAKHAMVTLHANGLRRMVLQVHDSILFELQPSQAYMDALHIKETMARAYPHKLLPMTVDASYSQISWADLGEIIPSS